MSERPPRPGRRARLGLAVVALALLLAGCKVDATVSVRVREDGSGVVRVLVAADAEAVKTVESGGGKIEDAVRLSDLAGSGWALGAWERAEDGAATIALTHRFSSVDQVAQIVGQISGDDGPLHGVRVTRDEGTFKTDYAASGEADLADVKTGVPADPELVASLSAQQVDPNVIDQQLLAQVKASFGLKVVVRLPGGAAKSFAPDAGGSARIDLSTSVVDTDRIAFLGAAVAFLVLALIVVLRPGRRRRRRRGNGPPARPAPARAGSTRPAPSPPPPPPRR